MGVDAAGGVGFEAEALAVAFRPKVQPAYFPEEDAFCLLRGAGAFACGGDGPAPFCCCCCCCFSLCAAAAALSPALISSFSFSLCAAASALSPASSLLAASAAAAVAAAFASAFDSTFGSALGSGRCCGAGACSDLRGAGAAFACAGECAGGAGCGGSFDPAGLFDEGRLDFRSDAANDVDLKCCGIGGGGG